MLKKPENYDSVVAKTGDYESLKLGGHECVITSALEYTGVTGTTSLQVQVDIAGNDPQKGFYKKQFDNNTSNDKKWSNGATKYVSLKEDDVCVAMQKGFITCLENSNAGFKFDWNKDWQQVVGKKIVGVWGLEEYENDKKEIKTATRLTGFRSLDKLKEIKIPKVKILTGTLIDYDEYMSKNKPSSTPATNEIDPFASIVEYDNSAIDL
jgi:hypothetical protein